jgi:uncharacterized protein
VPVCVAGVYESKLLPHASTFGQGVSAGSRLGSGAGIVFLPVEHDHRAARSAEEARLAAEIVEELLRCRWTDEKGREASLTADAPRHLDFLYSRNRLNVAVSRARCFAVVLASPKLLDVPCRTPELMRALNAFCQLLEASRDLGALEADPG